MENEVKSTKEALNENLNEFDSVLSDFLGEIIYLKNVILKHATDETLHEFCNAQGELISTTGNLKNRITSLKKLLSKFCRIVSNEVIYGKQKK